jgi:hypothetical protein
LVFLGFFDFNGFLDFLLNPPPNSLLRFRFVCVKLLESGKLSKSKLNLKYSSSESSILRTDELRELSNILSSGEVGSFAELFVLYPGKLREPKLKIELTCAELFVFISR